MADVNANINVDINTSSALANLRKLQGQITAFNESVISSNAAAAASQRQLNSSLIQQVSAIKGFSTSIGNVETSMSRLGTAIERNKLSLGEYFKYGVASSQTFGRVFSKEHNQVMDLAIDRVKRLQTQYVALGESQNGMTRALAARPLSLFNADAAIATQRSQIFNKLLRDGSTGLINFGKNTQWAGRQLMVGFTLPITMFGTVAAKVFSDLEKQIINFKRVYGDLGTTASETEVMVDQIKALGKEYTKYGIAVSDTIGLAAKAAAMGAQGADLMAATEEATRLATLGQIEQNQALDATISLQTAFKISSDELASSIDFLNAVENQTVTSLDDITVAIPKVAPVIKGLGGDVKDLALFMTAMREGGVNAAEGANALKSGLASLINPTKAAREQLAAVGINIDTILSKNKGDLRGLVTEFGDALGTVNKFERQQTLAKVFGKYQFARMGALFANINRDGSQASRVLDLAGASMEDLASLSEKELGNIEQAVSVKFTAAVEKLKLAIAPIGEMFLKIATPIVNVLTVVAEKFGQLPDVIKTVIAYGLGIGAVLVPSIIMLVGLLGNFLGNIMKIGIGFRSLMARITGNADAFQWLSTSELDAMAATASLEGATSSLTGVLAIQKETVDSLAAAYTRMADSAQIAASNMPQAMRGPIIGGRTPRRMATGGFVGGTGNKDTEPALLMPGEFVVNKEAAQKYGPVLGAMNSGKIKGYATGSDWSHVGSGIQALFANNQWQDSGGQQVAMPRFAKENSAGYAVIEIKKLLGESVKLVRNFVFDFDSEFNRALDNGTLAIKDFADEWDSRGPGKWAKTFDQVGISFDDFEQELRQFDQSLKDNAISIARQRGSSVITDADVEAAYIKTEQDLAAQTGRTAQEQQKMQKVLQAARKQYETIVGVQHSFSQESLRRLVTERSLSEKVKVYDAETGQLITTTQQLEAAANRRLILETEYNDKLVRRSISPYGAGQSERVVATTVSESGSKNIPYTYGSAGSSRDVAVNEAIANARVLAQATGNEFGPEFAKIVAQSFNQGGLSKRIDVAVRDGLRAGVSHADMETYLLERGIKPARVNDYFKKLGYESVSSWARAFDAATPDVVLNAMGKFRNSPHPSAFPAGEMDGKAYSDGFRLTASQARGAVLLGPDGKPIGGATGAAPAAASSGNQQGSMGNPINQVSREARVASKGFTKLGSILKMGGLKMQGAFFALDGLTIGLSMMNNSIGDFAQKLIPAVFALQGLMTVLPLLMNPVGLLVGGIAGLAALVIVSRNRLEDMFNKAVENGINAAGSMQKIADIGDVFGKKIRDISVKKLGKVTEQRSAVGQYFAGEEGSQKLSELKSQRASMSREKFAQQVGLDTAIAATSQGWTAKQLDAYIKEISSQLGDEKIYLNLRATLAELIDPKNKSDILEKGLLIKVRGEAGADFLAGQADISADVQKQLMSGLAEIPQMLAPEQIIERTVKSLETLPDEMESINQQIIEKTQQMFNTDDWDLKDKLDKEIIGLKSRLNEITPGNLTETNINIAAGLQGNQTPQDMENIWEKASTAAAKYGKAIFINRQAVALYGEALKAGRITQEQFDTAQKNMIKNMNNVKKYGYEAIETIKGIQDVDPKVMASFRTAFSEQAFAGLDEEMKKNVLSALEGVSDKAVVTLGVQYARGSINPQEVIDLTKQIDKIPEQHQTKIMVAYGNGSLTSDGLQFLAQNMETISQYSGKQVNFMVDISVLGEEAMKNAMAMMATIQNSSNPNEISGASAYLNSLKKQAAEARKLMDQIFGAGETEDGGETGTKDTGAGEKKDDPIKDYISGLITKVKQYQDINVKFKSLGNIFSKFQGLANNLRGKLPEGLIAELLSKGEDGIKIANAMINKRTGKLTKLGNNIKKLYEGSEIGNLFSDLQAETTAAQQKAQVAQSFKLPGNTFTKEQQDVILGNDALVRQFATVKAGTPAYKKLTNQVIALAAAQKMLAEATDEATQLDTLEKAWSDYANAVNAAFDAEKIRTEDALASAFLAKNKMTVEKMKEQIAANEKLIEKQQDLIDDKQEEVDKYQHINDLIQQRIDDMNREVEIRSRISDAISHDLDIMSQTEDKIKKGYDERIKALDSISSINQRIADQQRDQLGLSQALSQGDVYAAATAQQQMQQSQAQYAAEQVRAGLQAGMENEIANLRTSDGLTREQAEEKIAAIKEQNYQASLSIRIEEDKIYNNNLLIRGLNNEIYDIQNGIMKTYQDQNREYEKLLDNYQKELDYATSHLVAAGMTADQWDRANREHTSLIGQIAGNIELVNKYKAAWDAAARSAREAGIASSTASAPAVTASNGQSFATMSGTQLSGLTGSDIGAYLRWSGGGMGLAFGTGGLVPKKFARGGNVGMDSIPAMLTPGEFVMRKAAVDQYGKPLLSSMNMGAISSPRYNMQKGEMGSVKASRNTANINAPVYNTYSINVPVTQPGASADEIANKVMTKIRNVDNSSIRRINGY